MSNAGFIPISGDERAALLNEIRHTLGGADDLRLYADLDVRARRRAAEPDGEELKWFLSLRHRLSLALWFLDDLVAERETYYLTMPRDQLTGWLHETIDGTLDLFKNSVIEPDEADPELDILNTCRALLGRVGEYDGEHRGPDVARRVAV